VEIHGHAQHGHAEEIVDLVLVEERAPIEGGNAGELSADQGDAHTQGEKSRLRGARFRILRFSGIPVEAVVHLMVCGQARAADLDQPPPPGVHELHAFQQQRERDLLHDLAFRHDFFLIFSR